MRSRRAAAAGCLLFAIGCAEDGTAGGGGGGAGIAGGGGDGGAGGSVEQPAADPSAFRATGSLAEGRGHNTATLLADGRVLVTGGESTNRIPNDSVEIFDPETESWSALAPLPEPRTNHAALRLADGRVLITGGGLTNVNGSVSGEGVLASALLFDPIDGLVEPIGDMIEPRAGHEMVALADGRVLVAGGATDELGSMCTGVPGCTYGKALASAELFDPASGTFSAAGEMSDPRINFFMTSLADGRAFVAGGADDSSSLSSVEIFDPGSDAFVPTAELLAARFRLGGALLGSGRVVVAGGKLANVGPLDSTEVFDAAAGAWSEAGDLDRAMTGAALVALESGRALSVGGYDQTANESLARAAIFDESAAAWTLIGSLGRARIGPNATRLLDGRVLVIGGYDATNTCELSE